MTCAFPTIEPPRLRVRGLRLAIAADLVDDDDDHRARKRQLQRLRDRVGHVCGGHRRRERTGQVGPRARATLTQPVLAPRPDDDERHHEEHDERDCADGDELQDERVQRCGVDGGPWTVDHDGPRRHSCQGEGNDMVSASGQPVHPGDDARRTATHLLQQCRILDRCKTRQELLAVPVDDLEPLVAEIERTSLRAHGRESDAADEYAGDPSAGVPRRHRDDDHRSAVGAADQAAAHVRPARCDDALEVRPVADVGRRSPLCVGADPDDPVGVDPPHAAVEQPSVSDRRRGEGRRSSVGGCVA